MVVCPECGDDEVAEGLPLCLECMEKSRNTSSALEETVWCPCGAEVTEFLWAVQNVWYCSYECGWPVHHRISNQMIDTRPTSSARLEDSLYG